MTNLPLALAMAAAGLLLAWLVFREVKSGTIISRNTSVNWHDDPAAFGIVAAMQIGVLALCLLGVVSALGLAH